MQLNALLRLLSSYSSQLTTLPPFEEAVQFSRPNDYHQFGIHRLPKSFLTFSSMTAILPRLPLNVSTIAQQQAVRFLIRYFPLK